MASYQSQVAKNNQIVATQNANYATAAGEAKATDQALKERAAAAQTVAGIAASGIDVNSGSAKDTRVSQAELGQTDVERVRQGAALQSYGYRTQSSNFGAESTLDTAQAGYDATAGWMKGLGSLLGGVTKFAGAGGTGGGSTTDTGAGNYQDTGGVVI